MSAPAVPDFTEPGLLNEYPTMTRRASRLAFVPAVLPLCLLTLGGCATMSGVEEERVYRLADGVATVDTFTTVATVTALDVPSRRVTLTTPDGKSTRHRTSKGFDLAGLKLGQQVGVRVTEETVIEIRDDGTPASEATAVGVTAVGDGQAGALLESEAVESSARVVAIDAARRKATFQFADGTTRIMKIGRKSALQGLEVGETVIVQYAVSVLIATSN